MRNRFPFFISFLSILLFVTNTTQAQQYKLRQSTTVSGMNSESTIYVKGMRKRTESSGIMGIGGSTTIEQCDLQRTIKLNDKKKLYFIEPFAKEEIIDEDAKSTVKTKPVTPAKTTSEKGGVIHMWYNITDTGERKKMNGFTARHIWTTQKIKPDANSCWMKDSMIIKTDGWYIDLPQFNCPIRYSTSASAAATQNQPECKDQYISHRSGKGKLGFPLTETRTIIMGTGGAKTTEFTTTLETIEFASMKLDSMLFEIPPGYTQTMNEADLQDKVNAKDMMEQYKNYNKENGNSNKPEQKKPGAIRIGVLEPTGDGQIQQPSVLQQYLAGTLNSGNIEAVAVTSTDDAKKNECDYTLTTDFTKIKQVNKVGGLLKAIKNTDPNAGASFNIDATFNLLSVADGSTKLQQTLSGKYEGKVDDAAKKVLDEESRQIIKGLK